MKGGSTWLVGSVLVIVVSLLLQTGCDRQLREAAGFFDNVSDELRGLARDVDHDRHDLRDFFDEVAHDIEDWFD